MPHSSGPNSISGTGAAPAWLSHTYSAHVSPWSHRVSPYATYRPSVSAPTTPRLR